jgi:hypothetical protein
MLCDTPEEARARSRRGLCIALPAVLAASRRTSIPLPPRSTKIVGQFNTGDGDQGFPLVSWLVCLDGARAGETFRLATITAVGSAPPADIVLPDPELAALHARFESTPQGCFLCGIGEAQIFVNEWQIGRAGLVDNDIVRIGGTHLKFKSIN